MTGCDCGGNAHNEEHANDCAGWRLEVERLREVVRWADRARQASARQAAERQREACADLMDVRGHYRCEVNAIRATPLVTESEP